MFVFLFLISGTICRLGGLMNAGGRVEWQRRARRAGGLPPIGLFVFVFVFVFVFLISGTIWGLMNAGGRVEWQQRRAQRGWRAGSHWTPHPTEANSPSSQPQPFHTGLISGIQSKP